MSQIKSYGLNELICKFVEMDTNTFKPTNNYMNCYSWGSKRSQENSLVTGEKRTAAQCQIPIFSEGETRCFLEVAILRDTVCLCI